MRGSYVGVAAMIALPLATGYGDAQEIGLPGRGLALARRLCSQCHAVRKEQRVEPVSDVATGRSFRQQSGAAPFKGEGGEDRIVARRILIQLSPGAIADRRHGRVGCHAREESDVGV